MNNNNYNNQNNGGNDIFTPTTRSAYRFFNSESEIDNTSMSFNFWNSLLKITMNPIIVKEGSANKVDTDNHVDIYLSPSKAKMLLYCVKEFRKNPDAYTNIGVNTNKGIIFIANGDKMFGHGGVCIVINLINNETGEKEAEAAYEFNTKDLYAITSTNAVAASIMETGKFNEARQFSFIKDVREKLGISKSDGSKNYNRSSWFNNNGNSSSSVSSEGSKNNSSTYEDVMNDIASIMD